MKRILFIGLILLMLCGVASADQPIAIFSSDITTGASPLIISFTDIAKDETITEWTWDFGDKTDFSKEQNPRHTYTSNGIYSVTLTVTNKDGISTHIEKDYIEVTDRREPTPIPTVVPIPDPTYVPKPVEPPQEVKLSQNIVSASLSTESLITPENVKFKDSVNNIEVVSSTYVNGVKFIPGISKEADNALIFDSALTYKSSGNVDKPEISIKYQYIGNMLKEEIILQKDMNLSFPITLPTNTKIIPWGIGEYKIVTTKTNNQMTGIVVAKPFGIDYTGKKIDMVYTLNGTNLILNYDRRDITYPLIIDPTWYLDNPYEITHYINGSTSTLTNYPITMKIFNGTGTSSGENCYLGSNLSRSDFGDVRFTLDNSTELPYWIETGSLNATSARFWINMSSITGGQTNQTPIYIYFGNSSKVSASNGNTTFYPFEEFNNGTTLNTTLWTKYEASGTVTVSGGECSIASTGNGYTGIISNVNTTVGSAIRAYIKPGHLAGGTTHFENFGASDSGKAIFQRAGYANDNALGNGQFVNQNSGTNASNIVGVTANVYHTLDIIRNTTSAIYKINNANTVEISPYYNNVTLPIMANTYYSGSALTIEWILVRKYQYPEPTHSTYSGTTNITVTPVANFTANATGGAQPLNVSFTDSSTNTPTSWYWEFGDSNTSTSQNPTHVYYTGNWSVNMSATNSAGTDWFNGTWINVTTGATIPVASFSTNTTVGPMPLSIQFNDTSSNTPTSWNWSFGDGTFNESQNPIYTYAGWIGNTTTNYTVVLNATNSAGSNITQSNITAYPLMSNLSQNATVGIIPFDVLFNNTITNGTPTDYLWNWSSDGGTNITTQNATHTYSSVGVWSVLSNVSNSYSYNLSYLTVTATNATLPTVDFTTNTTSGYPSFDVNFTDVSTNATSWYWDFGDGGNSTDQNIVHTYNSWIANNSVNYNVNHSATNANGTVWKNTTNNITAYPLAHTMTSNVSSGKPVLFVQFNTTFSNGTATAWNWSFGGTNYSSIQNATFNYPDVGLHDVRLNSSNNYSYAWTNNVSMINVTALTPPVANFTANLTSGTSPLNVSFTDTSSNTPTAWNYSFGDGNYSTLQNPTHIFYIGNWSVNLTASNDDGTGYKNGTWVNVTSGVVAPVASFTTNATSGKIPLHVQFTDSSTNTPTSWLWQWGDGTANSTTQNPVHTFSNSGVYHVNLTATNTTGSNLSSDTTITAQALTPPVANFSANITSGSVPLSVLFTDNSTNSPTSWAWQFGDGTTNATTQNATHTYSTVAVFTVNLTSTNADGSNTSQRLNYITTSAAPVLPVAAFSANVTSGYVPRTVLFTDASTNATSWYWDLGDGSNSTDQNPTKVYSIAGTYTIKLQATNTNGTDWENKTSYLSFTNPPTPLPTSTPVHSGGYAPPYQAPDVPFPQNNNTGIHLNNVSVDTTNKTVTFTGNVSNATNDTTAWFTVGASPGLYSYYTVALVPDVNGTVTGSLGLTSPMAASTKYYVGMASTNGLALETLNFTTPSAGVLPTSTYSIYWNQIQSSNKTPLTILGMIPLPLVDLLGGGDLGWYLFFTAIIGILIIVIAVRQDSIIMVFMLVALTGVVWMTRINPQFIWIVYAVCALAAGTILYRLWRNRRS